MAGTYFVSDWTETNNVINITTEVTANGEGHAEVWFTCIPQESAQFSVEVATAGGKTYTKEFAKPITLTQNNVKAFSVDLESTNPDPEDNDYHLVESDLADWRGHYLVAYSDEVFMDGSLPGGTDGVGKASSSINLAGALSTDKKTITAEWGDNHYITIEAIDDSDLSKGYVIKTHSEITPYFYNTKNENGMSATANKSTAAAYPITIEFTNSSDVKIKLGGNASGSVLRYNTTDNGKMFRYYKNCSQSAIYLYKKASDYFTQVAVESIALDKTNLELAAGSTETLTATVAPANATNKAVSWSSSNAAIATVENGVVTAVAEGTAIITATSEENPTITATCEVSVTAASTGSEEKTIEFTYSSHTGWTVNATNQKNYYTLFSGNQHIDSPIISVSSIKSIVINTRTYGGGTTSQNVITIKLGDTVIGTITPTTNKLKNYTLSYLEISGTGALQFIALGSSSDKGPGIATITVTYIE